MTRPLKLAMKSLKGESESELIKRSDAFYDSHMTATSVRGSKSPGETSCSRTFPGSADIEQYLCRSQGK